MKISVVTGNKNKFDELRTILGEEVVQLDIELDEIQEIDSHKIIRHKFAQAAPHANGAFIVEDSSLHFDCLGGKLPGPLIKWFLLSPGLAGLAELAERMGNTRAVATTILGYGTSNKDVQYFEGEVAGAIVVPRGTQNFGFDPIFVPEGSDKTFAEMTAEEKHAISARGIAARKLKEYITSTQ